MEKTRCGKDAYEFSRCQNKYKGCDKRKECEIIWEEYLFLNLINKNGKVCDTTNKDKYRDNTSE